MNLLMKSVFTLLTFCCLTIQSSFAEQISSAQNDNFENIKANYSFPYSNPYLATLTVKLLKPTHIEQTSLTMVSTLKRTNIPFQKGPHTVDVAAYIQGKKAPLVYIIPGLGSHVYDGGSLFLAEHLFLKGFSTIVVPSPFFWRFVIAESSTGVVGYQKADAEDLRNLMSKARKMAEKNLGLKVSRSGVVGYSLGAINAAYIMHAERQNPVLGLERAVMINPPFHFQTAANEIDRMTNIGLKWTQKHRDRIMGYAFDFGTTALQRDINKSDYFVGLDKQFKLKDSQLQFLIGATFRQSLAEVIMMSQHINYTGMIDITADVEDRRIAAGQYSFNEYIEKYVWPFWTKKQNTQWTLKEFIEQNDLLNLADSFAQDPAYRLVHNQDDFLARPEDIKTISERMKNRAIIYPKGGHLGNLWMKQNLSDLYLMVKDLL